MVSSDSRPLLERLRRCQLWQLADKLGITYPAGAAATVMVDILKAQGVDPTQHMRFEPVRGKDEHGNPTVEYYPTVEQHHTADKSIDYDSVIAERIQGQDEQHEDNFDKARMDARERRIEQLEQQLAQLVDKLGDDDGLKPSDLPFKLTAGQKKQMLMAQGIDPKGMTRQEVDEALEG